MLWFLIAAFAVLLLWSQRRGLRLPSTRAASVAALSVLALLAARSGRLSIAAALGLVAVGLAVFWRGNAGRAAPRGARRPAPPPPPGGPLTVREAYAVLGLEPGAGPEEIKQAHRRLMKLAHPDAGGSTLRAARLNAAKDLLLGRG